MLTATLDTARPGWAPSGTAPALSRRADDVPPVENWARYVRCQWPHVTITDADIRVQVVKGRNCRSACAYVRLGKLLPLDVDVSVTRAGKRIDDARNGTRVPEGEWPLFSVAPMHNGIYKYEAELPWSSDDADCFWTVRVSPARPIAGIQPASVSRTVIDAPAERASSSTSPLNAPESS